jgi:hypothetical protein
MVFVTENYGRSTSLVLLFSHMLSRGHIVALWKVDSVYRYWGSDSRVKSISDSQTNPSHIRVPEQCESRFPSPQQIARPQPIVLGILAATSLTK